MSTPSLDAGKLNKPAQVLELKETSSGVWAWVPIRKAWASIELQPKSNLFSQVGVGARDASIILRKQALTLHNALSWGGQHFFLTSITARGRGHLDVDAAVVSPVTCLAVRTETTLGEGNRPTSKETLRVSFPGILTEKYVRYEREDTHDEVETALVLVTPKEIALRPGDLVTVQTGPATGTYHIQLSHVLDPVKNEYEMARRGDV